MHRPLSARAFSAFTVRDIVAAVFFLAALPFSLAAHAINIGEVVSQSKIGEPLRTQIELTGSGSELVEDACLSLVAPDQNEEGSRDFVTMARVAVKVEGDRRFVVISSNRSYNDPFLRLRLRVRCAGVGNMVKSFTILPDFAEAQPIAAPSAAAPGATASGLATSASIAATSVVETGSGRSATQGGTPERRAGRSRRSKQRTHTTERHGAVAAPAPRKQGQPETFRLRLSGEAIDESRIGKISPEERSILLARQKLLDADDQMASFLALQNQVKQLQDELGAVKLKLGQLGASAPVATPLAVPAQVAPGQEAAPQPGAEARPEGVQGQAAPAAKQKRERLNRTPIVLGLLALLSLLLGLRHWMRIRAQGAGAKPVLKRAAASAPDAVATPALETAPAPAPAPIRAPATAVRQPAQTQVKIAQPGARPAAKPVAKPAAPKARASVAEKPQPVAPVAASRAAEPPAAAAEARDKTPEELAEAESIIEEAELYAIHGHAERAIAILKELLQQHPGKIEAWMLLFSIYSSMKRNAEFEQSARGFIAANKDSSAWPEIQALGRSFDPTNVLYADLSAGGAAAPQAVLGKRVLLGDILLAMGALSTKDMEQSLAEFNPKVDGRLGGFLVKRNLITEAQLEAALLQQQLSNEANTLQAEEPPAAPEKPTESKGAILPDLEFERPAVDLPKMTHSLDSGSGSGAKTGSR